jgi:hypothetical protein
MKGDFSKLKSPQLIAKEHYHDVFLQQGRVSLDQDWNNQSQINMYRIETALSDIIGRSGAPFDNAGFKIEPFINTSPPVSPLEGDLKISAGHFYVDGILCENDEDISFEDQPDYPSQKLPTNPGNYLFYLDVWLRHITALEDDSLREVALGGPDTTTRTKVIWQVKCNAITSPASPPDSPDCTSTSLPGETNPSTGTLSAQSAPEQDSSNPCDSVAAGGYRRLQNQLYRVEIHKSGDASKATYKWQRDNGSIVTKWLSYGNDPSELTVSSLGKDELLGFNLGDWIEIIDDATDLLVGDDTTGSQGKPGILARISKPPQNNVITVDLTSAITPDGSSLSLLPFDKLINPRVRKWDSSGEISITTDTWVDVEDGVQIKLEGHFKTGDYWLIPARTAIADVEWEKDGSNTPLKLLPFGVVHHYAKLAILNFDTTNGWSVVSDCRNLFSALTEQISLCYVGGDGQESAPNNVLPEPLMVGVANGSLAVSGVKVKFEIKSGGGSLDTPVDGIVVTGNDGIAKCNWTLGNDTSTVQQVQASLVDEQGSEIPQKLPVIFSAGFNSVTTDTKKGCTITVGTGGDFETLEEAIQKINSLVLCICLLPQTHEISNARIEKKELVKITGCGAKITLEGDFSIQSEAIVLSGLNIETPNPTDIKLSSSNISADNCSFSCSDSEVYLKAPFILITPITPITVDDQQSTAIIYWNRNQITVGNKSIGIGLALAPGVGGWITKNIITGALILDFDTDPAWNIDMAGRIQNMVAGGDLRIIDQLNIHGNIVGNIMTNGEPIIKNNFISRTIIVSENLFQRNIQNVQGIFGNNFVSQLVSLINNQFLESKEQNEVVIVGQKGVVTGNIAVNDNTKIKTFLNPILGKTPLQSQPAILNLVSVE